MDAGAIELALKSGVIDDFVELDEDLSNFDFIVLSTPLSAYKKIFDRISQTVSDQTILIDLGSLKEFVTKILPKNLEKNFVACHPIAGSEKVGFENSSADLFAGKKFVICPSKNNNAEALKKVEAVAKAIGCEIDLIDAKKHDEIYALVSHLPQFLSFLTSEFSPKKIEDEFFKTAFRLDNSDPEIWSDIFALNGKNLEKFYLKFFENLDENMESIHTRTNHPPLESKVIKPEIDEKFLEENFAPIFFRAIVVTSYLQIPEIKTFQTHAGSGFRDFTSIASILEYDEKKLAELIKKNQQKIFKIFNSLSWIKNN